MRYLFGICTITPIEVLNPDLVLIEFQLLFQILQVLILLASAHFVSFKVDVSKLIS